MMSSSEQASAIRELEASLGEKTTMRFNYYGTIALLALAVSVADAVPPSPSVALSAAGSAAVRQGVRALMESVAHDVTQQGPLAWSRYFDDSPEFFMAVNGQVVFSSGMAAKVGIPKVAPAFRSIELNWGNDLRIDPLTRRLAIVAVPWREVLTDSRGHVMKQAGYFTGTAEYRNGHWLFRDVHWSTPVPFSPKS
jgi:hypothetical protein